MLGTQRAYPCLHCGAARARHAAGLCWDCELDRRLDGAESRAQFIVCQNCAQDARNRGRGLCARCYQRLWRTGALPPPNLTTPEEVLGD